MTPVRVDVTLLHGYASFRASLRSPEAFAAFQSAISEGTRYIRRVGARVAALDQVPSILCRLRNAGEEHGVAFDTALAPDLRHAIDARDAHQWLDAQGVKERIARIDAELKARTGNALFPYQHTGAMWLAMGERRLLADDMGLGKTLQIITALPAGAPVVVVCPAKVKGEWQGEMRKWRPQLAVTVLRGKDSFRWPTPGEMVILNYDILPDIHDRKGVSGRVCKGFLPPGPCKACATREIVQHSNVVKIKDGHLPTCTGKSDAKVPCPGCHPLLTQAPPGCVVVYDEAQYLKNANAGRSRQAKAVAAAATRQQGRCWLMSGTPMENHPQELWNVLEVADLAEAAFDNFPTFLRLFHASKKSPRFGGLVFGTPDDEVKERLRRVSLRRLTSEVQKDLPEKLYKDVVVDIDAATLRACDAFAKAHGGVERIAELLRLEKFPFEVMSSVRSALATAKIPALLEYIQTFEEAQEPVVVFSAHRAPIEAVGKRPGWATILGGTSDAATKEAIHAFQAGKLRGIGITIKSGGTGITLTRGAYAVFVDKEWNAQANRQAEKRIHRIGQKRTSHIVSLQANHLLDRRVSEVINEKTLMFEATVDAAAVDGDATPNAELLTYLARVEEELAHGTAVRHTAGSEAEQETLAALAALVFESPKDDALASRLGEEAGALGLTDAQWALAAALVTKGVKPPTEEADPPENTNETENVSHGNPSLDAVESTPLATEAAHPPRRKKPAMRIVKDSESARVPTSAETPSTAERPTRTARRPESGPDARLARRAERASARVRAEADDLIDDLVDVMLKADPEDRVYILNQLDEAETELEEQMCLGCGDEPHASPEECPAFEEDEEDEGAEPTGPVSQAERGSEGDDE